MITKYQIIHSHRSYTKPSIFGYRLCPCITKVQHLITFQVYSVCDAIAMHRETHHPSQIGFPDALVNAYIELSLSADKKVSLIGRSIRCFQTDSCYICQTITFSIETAKAVMDIFTIVFSYVSHICSMYKRNPAYDIVFQLLTQIELKTQGVLRRGSLGSRILSLRPRTAPIAG